MFINYQLLKANDFYFNNRICRQINNIIKITQETGKYSELPNILFYGPEGCGKYSTMLYFILSLYNVKPITDNYNIFKTDEFKIKIKKTEYIFNLTEYYLLIDELNSVNDKNIIQEVIKSYVSKKTIDDKIKFIVIRNIDKLSYYAQMSLRRSMEIYNKYCKFILLTEKQEGIIEPLKSRCISFRFIKPKDEELKNLLTYLIKIHNLNINDERQKEIILNSDNNITLFFVSLNYFMNNLENTDNIKIIYDKIFDDLFDKDVSNFLIIRSNIIDLLKNGEKSNSIINNLTNEINKRIEDMNIRLKVIAINNKTLKQLKNDNYDLIILDTYLLEILFILTY